MQIADLKFLVAEKEEFHRNWLVTMLINLGAQHIVEVVDGKAALATLEDPSQHVDISLIEIDLPGMDGMELIRRLSTQAENHALVLVSGLDPSLLFSVETMSTAYGVDLLGTIEKPVSPEKLKIVIERFLTGQARGKIISDEPIISFDEIQEGMDNNQFFPYFQPKIDLLSREVVGVEAFARWLHPKYGFLLPACFIPLLEERGAMAQLSGIILAKSIEACLEWHELGFPLTVSINISPSVLAHPNLAETIIAFVAEKGMTPSYVIFEITESSTVTNGAHFLENLARLRMNGFGLSVDDYGSGKSSMQQLMRIPFSELKIDRVFVAGAAHNHALELVLSSSLALCIQLERKSVAVGVETRQDWDFLVKLGCTYAQGFYIAKPMDKAALPTWMNEWGLFF